MAGSIQTIYRIPYECWPGTMVNHSSRCKCYLITIPMANGQDQLSILSQHSDPGFQLAFMSVFPTLRREWGWDSIAWMDEIILVTIKSMTQPAKSSQEESLLERGYVAVTTNSSLWDELLPVNKKDVTQIVVFGHSSCHMSLALIGQVSQSYSTFLIKIHELRLNNLFLYSFFITDVLTPSEESSNYLIPLLSLCSLL